MRAWLVRVVLAPLLAVGLMLTGIGVATAAPAPQAPAPQAINVGIPRWQLSWSWTGPVLKFNKRETAQIAASAGACALIILRAPAIGASCGALSAYAAVVQASGACVQWKSIPWWPYGYPSAYRYGYCQ